MYCADIGSVPNKRFGWARTTTDNAGTEVHASGLEIDKLVASVAEDLAAGEPVALGFECPLFVPVPDDHLALGKARDGEGNRPWSGGAGSGAMATGLVQVAWILTELRRLVGEGTEAYLDWQAFAAAKHGLFLWEAFVSGKAKVTATADPHVQDAKAAVQEFRRLVPELQGAGAVTAERPLSLLGAAMLWSGWSTDQDLLHSDCLVIKAPVLGDSSG